MSECELAEECRKGNNQARKKLYELYAGKMLSLCTRYTNDRDVAHDLLHDGFLRAYAAISSFSYRGEGSLRAWLSRIFTNLSLEYLRKKNTLHATLSLDDASDVADESGMDFDKLPMDTLMGFIFDLPIGYRTVFNLYVFEGWSHKEIAAKLNINEKSSASQLTRARKLLIKKINEYINKKK